MPQGSQVKMLSNMRGELKESQQVDHTEAIKTTTQNNQSITTQPINNESVSEALKSLEGAWATQQRGALSGQEKISSHRNRNFIENSNEGVSIEAYAVSGRYPNPRLHASKSGPGIDGNKTTINQSAKGLDSLE